MKKKLKCVGVIFSLILFWTCNVWAVPVQMKNVFWDMAVSYGSGNSVGDGQIDSATDQKLPPSNPDTLPNTGDVDVTDDPIDPIFYSYASFDADVNYVDAYVEGFAGDLNSNTVDWFSALSKAAIGSDPLSGVSAFALSFDWYVTFDLDTAYNSGLAKIGIGLVDWTTTTDPNNPDYLYKEILNYSNNNSGTYSNSWNNLDPNHEYVLGVGVFASINGADDINFTGGSVEVGITNLNANASSVPEPGTLFLLGSSLFGICLLSKRKK